MYFRLISGNKNKKCVVTRAMLPVSVSESHTPARETHFVGNQF